MIWAFNYASVKAINELLETHDLALTKRFGQNFLINESVTKKIAFTLGDIKDKSVWEIGAGIGALTKELLLSEAVVTSFEIDRGFCKILKEEAFKDLSNFRLIEGDVLKTLVKLFKEEGRPDYVCGNLPYNVGSIAIANLIEMGCFADTMVFTLQKEVAQRMEATVGSKLYNPLSILVQVYYEVQTLFMIKPTAFYPSPKVDSATIKLTKRENSLVEESLQTLFFRLVNELFANRRKTIRNNFLLGTLIKDYSEQDFLDALKKCFIEPTRRSETLSIKELREIALAFPRINP